MNSETLRALLAMLILIPFSMEETGCMDNKVISLLLTESK